ncbi:AAC(3) family N-acetyltransferase [Streptomyces europaeiscabiei]|uniref:AAC(3) family N-acetyltransferase n=1 Tax=Streptomyces europaeiscabiei TaxID=146819 RepID=UPI0029B3512F|nr:AAC(3) family N-acetyltransferase [Streptomyces europaeiscabiei]MDX3689529.1 AAC(3) family N-acetyltransferase [Streptomyces europaeiscabiei]
MADITQLEDMLRELGVRAGGVLMMHSSLSGTGWSPTEVRDAVRAALGTDGTLVVPSFTPENSDTSPAYHRLTEGMTERERAEFRASMPPFEPNATPCPAMGALAECVRTTPGAIRSAHPQTSFAALGPRAEELLAGHDPHCHLGERSPMAALYAADAQVLLLRVGFEVCTAFHLAEYRMIPTPPSRTYRCVTKAKGNWIEYEDLSLHDRDFGEIGALLPHDLCTEGEFAGRPAFLFGMRDAVDTAQHLMSGYRSRMT